MDRATEFDGEGLEETRQAHETYRQKQQWKKRRDFSRRNRKPSKPSTYMGQRSNCRPRSL